MAKPPTDEVLVVECITHARRKFEEAVKVLPEAGRKNSIAQRGIRFYYALFAVKHKLENLSPYEPKEKRAEQANPMLNELHDCVFLLNAAPKSLLGKVVHYTREQ